MIYGASTIKRDRRTRDRVDQLDRQILEVLAADFDLCRALAAANGLAFEPLPASW